MLNGGSTAVLVPLTLLEPAAEARGDPCSTCGACCRGYYVPVTGFDLWRICHSLGLNPGDFVVAFGQQPGAPFGFRLRHDGECYELALEKKGRFALGQSCVFLEELPGGVSRCGIYAIRPGVCRAYPIKPNEAGVMAFRRNALCPSGAWPADEADRPHWREIWQTVSDDFERYSQIVQAWNEQIDAHPGLVLSLSQYIHHVLTVYDRLANLAEPALATT
jgi:Fe-S-cluster containining protein